jgi:hypothetical protein
LIYDQELARRQETQYVATSNAQRGYQQLFFDSVMLVNKSADFDFLMPPQTSVIPKVK